MNFLQDIFNRYTEPHRVYHNLEHISRMLLDAFDINENKLTKEQFFAILYHDAVYNPNSDTNEEDSAIAFKQIYSQLEPYGEGTETEKNLYYDMKQHCISNVTYLILKTKYHTKSQSVNEDSVVVLDSDLIGLADSYTNYLSTVDKIKKESNLSDAQWKVLRIEFLKKMLTKNKIFYHKHGKYFEAKARENMLNELMTLMEK